MSGSFPFPIQVTQNVSTGAEGDTDKPKIKPFRCGDCEQDFSAICLLHTHLRGGSYHYDQETMTAFPLSGTTCMSVFKRMKTETSKATPDSTRKIFKIKKIRKKGTKRPNRPDSDEEWTPSLEELSKKQSSQGRNEFEKTFNIISTDETENRETEADGSIQETEYTEMELNGPGQSSSHASEVSTPKKKKRQLVINLYGMDRNEDGSLRLVVGEKDSGVFRTPAGDAILKALKAKGQLFKGHMKVIYNYPNNAPDPDIEEEEADEDLEEEVDEPDETDSPKKMSTRSSTKEHGTPKRKTDTITISPLSSDSSVKPTEVKATAKEIIPTTSGDAVVFKTADEKLSTMEATDILNDVLSGRHLEKIARMQILRPRGSEVYIMDLDALPKTKERKVDTFKWNNCGSKRYPKNRETIIKTVYKVRLPNGYFSDVFVKHFYQMLDNPRYCVIHYIGDPPLIHRM